MGQKQTGHFKHTYDNGDTYDGEFVNGKRQGRGVYTSAGGHKYEGEWHDDQRHGFGIFTFTTTNPDGSTQWQGTYEGEWKNNLKEGPGTFNYATGDVYSGQWSEDKKHHAGIYTYANKDVFKGEFRYGLMHGSGVYTYANGDRVTGRWQDDVQDGLSVFVSADGSLREEQWEAGERMTSRAIGSADPLSISSQLDAERIQRKVSMDIAQWHLVQRQHASASGILDTVSPRIAPEPRGSIQGTAHEMLEKLAIMQAQAGVGQEKQTTGHADSGAVHVSESVHSDSDPAAPAAAAVVVPDHKSPSHATAAAHLALSKERDSQPEHVDIDELAKELQDENLE